MLSTVYRKAGRPRTRHGTATADGSRPTCRETGAPRGRVPHASGGTSMSFQIQQLGAVLHGMGTSIQRGLAATSTLRDARSPAAAEAVERVAASMSEVHAAARDHVRASPQQLSGLFGREEAGFAALVDARRAVAGGDDRALAAAGARLQSGLLNAFVEQQSLVTQLQQAARAQGVRTVFGPT